MEIDEETIEDVGERAKGLLRHYEAQINRLYEQEGSVKIALPVELKYDKTVQGTKVKVKISFVTDKVEDESTGYVGQRQGDLFDKQAAEERANVGSGELKRCPLRPGDEIYASYCNNHCPFRREIILVDGLGFDAPEILDEIPAQMDPLDMIQYRPCASWSDEDTKENIAAMLEWEPAEPIKTTSELCQPCEHHRRKGNVHKGVTVPGAGGKCIRPEGICLEAQAAIAAMREEAA